MEHPGLQHVALFSTRAEVREAAKQELEALGAGEVDSSSSADEVIEYLFRHESALLLIDWEVGSKDVNAILGAIKGHFHVETRPVFLLATQSDSTIVATGLEYGVTYIHLGAVSRLSIRDGVQVCIDEFDGMQGIRDSLVRIADLRERGEWDTATEELKVMHADHPNSDRVTLELAENLIQTKNFKDAEDLLGDLAQSDPPSVRALHLLGRCQLAQGHHGSAIGLLEKANLINPDRVDRLVELGEAFLQIHDYAAAQSNFDRAMSVAPKSDEARAGKGKCLLLAGEINEAFALVRQSSGPREVASIFNTAAVLAARNKKYADALNLYEKAVQLIGADDQTMAKLYFNMGLGYRRWRKPVQALSCFEKATELDPQLEKASRHKFETADVVAKAEQQAQTAAGEPLGDSQEFPEDEFEAEPIGQSNNPNFASDASSFVDSLDDEDDFS